MKGRTSIFMSAYARLFACCIAALPLHTAFTQEVSTLEDLITLLEQKSTEVVSWSSDISMEMKVGGVDMSYTGTTYNKGESSLTSITVSVRGQRIAVKTVIGPDQVQWNESMVGGKRQISMLDMNKVAEAANVDAEMLKAKMGSGPGSPININLTGKELLDDFSLTYDLKYVGKETLGDEAVYTVQGIIFGDIKGNAGRRGPLSSAGITANKIRMSIGAEDGFLRSMEMIDGRGKSILTLTYTNVVLNPDLDDRMFVYVAPPGSTITDMTPLTLERVKKDRFIEEANTP